MRNLTIKRAKRFVACLVRIQIYVEDAAGDVTIGGRLCRKLGTLKNGEEQTFQITNEAVRIFAIADKVSKGYCVDYYQLEEGDQDIFLTGKNVCNPAAGNPFRFDNNTSEGIETHRKKGNRIGLLVLAVAMVFGLTIGAIVGTGIVTNKQGQEKVFTAEGMEITLTGAFRKIDYSGYTAVFDSENVAVFTLKESFALMQGLENYTLQEYRDLLVVANGLVDCTKKQENGLTSFEYEVANTETDETYHYYTYVYKCGDGFWMVQFATLKENMTRYESQIVQWASSVQFSN